MTSDQRPAAGGRNSEIADWQRMRFKTNKVWMAVDNQGQAIVRGDKVLIKYQLEQDYEYWVKRENVTALESPGKAGSRRSGKYSGGDVTQATVEGEPPSGSAAAADDHICVYTDGASSGNPGPSGIGVVLQYGEHEKEISRFIGNATNNIAELEAIQTGLAALKNRNIPVRLFTDSNYAHGLLMRNWKPKQNRQLVASIKQMMATFKDLKIIKVKGHSGHPQNERADFLATSAIKKATR